MFVAYHCKLLLFLMILLQSCQFVNLDINRYYNYFVLKLHIKETENTRKCTIPTKISACPVCCHRFTYTSNNSSCLYWQHIKCRSWDEWGERQRLQETLGSFLWSELKRSEPKTEKQSFHVLAWSRINHT